MAKVKKKTKAEELNDAVSEAVGAGVEHHLETVDFSDPNRPKTCLETDFPIVPINGIASLEATSGAAKKPIYKMTKWWARRQSSVFRSMLIAAAAKAPDDPAEAASVVWNSYYGNHSKNDAFKKLKVADIFMGGGTTVVEGSRLGLNMFGCDLNPVAWFVVQNEMKTPPHEDVEKAAEILRDRVRRSLIPFFATDCPHGHCGTWTNRETGARMESDFEPAKLLPDERNNYDYHGPEIIYTFWALHGTCAQTECNHQTPILTSPVVATRSGRKAFSVKVWENFSCNSCEMLFDIEPYQVRLAPRGELVISESEQPYSTMDETGHFTCPHCGRQHQDQKARLELKSSALGKPTTKKVSLTVLLHPDWSRGLKWAESGGCADDCDADTNSWNQQRHEQLKLVEFRGPLPEIVTLADGTRINTSRKGGTSQKDAHFICMEPTCGVEQKILASTEKTGKTRPISPYAIQIYCPACAETKAPGSGRFFDSSGGEAGLSLAVAEWGKRRNGDLKNYWPKEEIPHGSRTHVEHPLPRHGYTHWWKMFNSRQLLCNALILKEIASGETTDEIKFVLMAAFQQYCRCNNLFTIWHRQNNQISAALSNSTFNVKNNVVETNPFSPVGDGSWNSAMRGVLQGIEWRDEPWELATKSNLMKTHLALADRISGKSKKVYPRDAVQSNFSTRCQSATSLNESFDGSFDMVITDPPFEGLIQYSETADFFYVWLRLVLASSHPEKFSNGETPKSLEAVYNPVRNGSKTEALALYTKILTECWTRAYSLIKPHGLMAFTFHHSEDEPWVRVLQSLFDAGFFLEATYPIRSDETKGDGDFGSQKIEFDIIHVCRKRIEDVKPVSWARLRRAIVKDIKQIESMLKQHEQEGLGKADLQVIRRGKALEYFSRHYGKVYIERGREDEFTVKDALVGINQLLDDESQSSNDSPPFNAEPYTRQFLRLFCDKTSMARDQIQKFLRGTGVSPNEFSERGWCNEVSKVFHLTPPLEWAQEWKGKPRKSMSRDFDQTYFLIGACYKDSGIKVSDTLNSGSFVPHPAIGDLLNWFVLHGSDQEMKDAADRARSIYKTWEANNTKTVESQKSLFDMEGEG